MTFTPPEFKILSVNTRNLETVFSTLLGRYKIITDPPVSEAVSSGEIISNTLETLLARTHKVVICKTDRETARDVFKQLSNELREVLKENNEEKNKQAILFLLGALLHRYFRLIKEYDNFNSYIPVPSFFFKYKPPSDVKDCRLFQAIRLALGLPEVMEKNYRINDLKILDVTTIVTALETFRDNMQLIIGKDEGKMPRYKSYPHFAADKNFETYLQEIIDEHKRRNPIVLNQFKAINFIQSLVKQIEEEQHQIEEALTHLGKLLPKTCSDFKTISLELMEEQIKAQIESNVLQEKIIDLLYTGHIQENFSTMDCGSFIEAMKNCNNSLARYRALGGYCLLLQNEGVKEQLRFCIHQALGVEINPNELTDKDMLDAIRLLKTYFEANPKVELNFDFFGGKGSMNTFILQTELALAKKVQTVNKAQEDNSETRTTSLFV
ncbi:lpg1751 family Dot/Icm T4SS effector [Legionella pneumophila]|uniref:lpg1751 family Dot/Icm T4SS effector n=1 Tax=Legionella pneumophila TaxID=446 RepID=UPI0039C43630